MRKVRNLMVITCMVLMCAMQAMAVTYAPAKPQKKAYGHPVHMVATAPATTFQSTSSLQYSGSVYTTTPALNANGTVDANAYGVGQTGPRRAKMDGDDDDEGSGLVPPDDPNAQLYEDEENKAQETTNGFPIGDAVLPLLLMSLAFCGYVYLRKRKAA